MAGTKANEFARIREAYVSMATEGRYRPAAPGDGMGSVYLSEEELADSELLNKEASEYAAATSRRIVPSFMS